MAGVHKFKNSYQENRKMQSVSGKYVGVFKGDGIGDIAATMRLEHEGGKISGSVDTPNGPAPITSGLRRGKIHDDARCGRQRVD
jgi:hypothetical protein